MGGFENFNQGDSLVSVVDQIKAKIIKGFYLR